MQELQAFGLSSSLSGEAQAKVYMLNAEQIEHYWASIEECLREDPTLWATYFTLEGLHAKALDGSLQVWVICPKEFDEAIKTVFFTHILQSEVGKDLQVFWAWGMGALRALSYINSALDRFAEHCDCRNVTVIGRVGWVRALRELGEFEAVIMRRPVRSGKEQ